MKIKAKKSLGQNFLTDKNIIKKIKNSPKKKVFLNDLNHYRDFISVEKISEII